MTRDEMRHLPADYYDRAATLGLAPPAQVRHALGQPDTVVLDVRRLDEVHETGHLPLSSAPPTVLVVVCTGGHVGPVMEQRAAQNIPTSTTPVVVYCRSGKRASITLERLRNMGYSNVINAGGLEDVLAIMAAPPAPA